MTYRTLAEDWEASYSDVDQYGRKRNPTGSGHSLYLGTEEGVQVDSMLNSRENSIGADWLKNTGSGSRTTADLINEKLKNAGLTPPNPDGTTSAPSVDLPPVPTLPTINLPATPGLPGYTPPGTPPGLPTLQPGAEMPTIGTPATNAGRVRTVDAITARRGRSSTFLTTPEGRTPATPAVPKPPMARSRRTGAGVFG